MAIRLGPAIALAILLASVILAEPRGEAQAGGVQLTPPLLQTLTQLAFPVPSDTSTATATAVPATATSTSIAAAASFTQTVTPTPTQTLTQSTQTPCVTPTMVLSPTPDFLATPTEIPIFTPTSTPVACPTATSPIQVARGDGIPGDASTGGTVVPTSLTVQPTSGTPGPVAPPAQPGAPGVGGQPGQGGPACQDWIAVFTSVGVFSATGDPPLGTPVWFAEPGQWYIVQLVEGGYALAVLDTDAVAAGNDSPVWFNIQGDPPGIEGVRIC
jgi:hypothetical protein